MSRSPLSLAFLHRPTIIAMGVIILAAACDRESPTSVSRPAVRSTVTPSASILPPGDEKPLPAYEIKTFGIEVVGGNSGTVEVLCSPGNRALGGGFQIGGGILIAGPDVAVYESSPRVTSGTDGWRLTAMNRGTDTRQFDVWVICAPF